MRQTPSQEQECRGFQGLSGVVLGFMLGLWRRLILQMTCLQAARPRAARLWRLGTQAARVDSLRDGAAPVVVAAGLDVAEAAHAPGARGHCRPPHAVEG